jgi:predicted flap endonuclease-1-like 5' DNA nuclease
MFTDGDAWLKGGSLWILGFFAFLAGLNAVNAVFLWVEHGPHTIIQPYLIGSLTGGLSIATYFWISILAAFVFLGMTLSSLLGKLPDATMFDDVIERMKDLKNDDKVLEKIKTRLMIIDASLSDIRRGFLEGFSEQGADIKKIRLELFNKLDKKLTGFKEEMTKSLEKMEKSVEKALKRAEATNKKSVTTITNKMREIANIKSRLEKLERELTQPKPQLTSRSELRKVKGIGTHLAKELEGIGITSVGELILTDPLIIAEKTGTSQKTVERLQGRAQLLMVPGITEKDLTLLEELGITTRRKLAEQDPIELGRKMNGILKAYVENGKISEAEKPTIEEIASWIKLAKP